MKLLPEPSYPTAPRPSTFQDGLEFQDFVCVQLAKDGMVLQNLASKKYQFDTGENLQGWEIKLDLRCLETGRLSIEVAEKSDARKSFWTPSGIYRDDNTWLYIQGNYERLYVFAKNWLQRYDREKKPKKFESHGTVRKFYLPLADADKYASRIFDWAKG